MGPQSPWVLVRHYHMNSKEINNLMKNVDRPLRERWEKRKLGQSLREVQALRLTALALSEKYQNKMTFWTRMTAALFILFLLVVLVAPLITKAVNSVAIMTITIAFVVTGAPYLFIIRRLVSLSSAMEEQGSNIERYNTFFKSFEESIEGLNPLASSLGNPMFLTEEGALQIAVDYSAKVSAAEENFDICCKDRTQGQKIPRHNVTEAGIWLQRTQDWLDKVLNTAKNDFELPWEQKKIFQLGVAQHRRTKSVS